jgi:RNA polymerase sigma-70 factor (ECF subfamily)
LHVSRILRDRRQALLVRWARAGHAAAFRRLYRELYPPVARYVSARVAGREEAEDLVARTFHELVRSLDRYDPGRGSVWTWVMTLARHEVIDHWRMRRPTRPLDDLEEMPDGEMADPLAELIRREDLARVRDLLALQPPEVRRLFELRYVAGLRHRQIGEQLGLSEAAVRQRLSRCLRQLRDELEGRSTEGGGHEHAFSRCRRRTDDTA